MILFLLGPIAGRGEEIHPSPTDSQWTVDGTIVTNRATGCIQPAPLIRIQDYNGPLAKLVGTFAQRLERSSVQLPNYLPGVKQCSFGVGDKFKLFLHNSTDPVAGLSVAFYAGQNHAMQEDPSLGTGGVGYAKRFAVEYADQTTHRFFSDFLYPSLFHEDPRYYRQAHGGFKSRLLHAMAHTVVAKRDDGAAMFNYNEWLGSSTSVALGHLYHPDSPNGLKPAFESGGFLVMQDMGFDVLREFWPEIAHTLRLPFRGNHDGKQEDVQK